MIGDKLDSAGTTARLDTAGGSNAICLAPGACRTFLLEEFEAAPTVPISLATATIVQTADVGRRGWICYLQWRSHQEGGLRRLAWEICNENLSAIGSPTMLSICQQGEATYSGGGYECVCDELAWFPLSRPAELRAALAAIDARLTMLATDSAKPKSAYEAYYERRYTEERQRERTLINDRLLPSNRQATADEVMQQCRLLALALPTKLYRLCADPAEPPSVPYLSDLGAALQRNRLARGVSAMAKLARTEPLVQLHRALDQAYQAKGLVVIQGDRRTGKSTGANAWLEANAHRGRVVRLQEITTPRMFFELTWSALGRDTMPARGVAEMASEVARVFRESGLMLIIDEAQLLLGASAAASLNRLLFIATELCDKGLPVVLLVPPTFEVRLRNCEDRLHQPGLLLSRVSELPEMPPLGPADFAALTHHLMPVISGEAATVFEKFGETYGMEAVVRAAPKFLARVAGLPPCQWAAEAKEVVAYALPTVNRVLAGMAQR